ncbi:MAG: alpha/beta fold hydrolase, partial [Mycobacterium sp.]|nr:alpha/beta fold hydrolase [Mycobacterium sp.]
MQPFTVDIEQSELDTLRFRLEQARWPEAETVDDWSQGVPLEYLRRLCRYWATGYDWRRAESTLNAWPQLRTTIDGLGIHLLHVRSPHAAARPLLLTHGWPGSVFEFAKVIGPLVDPVRYGGDAGDAFHVVVPSLPGYGFSDRPARTGWGIERIASAWATLMARLGYDRYGAMGSDWGTSITTLLAQSDATHVAAVHLVPPLAPPDRTDDLTPWEQRAIDDLDRVRSTGSAYSEIHRTRPQTIGYALVDSPIALCAWIAEKYYLWSDGNSGLTDDDVLNAVTLYWLTRTGASAARLYYESISTVATWFTSRAQDEVPVPVGASIFDHETPRISRRWAADRYPDIR